MSLCVCLCVSDCVCVSLGVFVAVSLVDMYCAVKGTVHHAEVNKTENSRNFYPKNNPIIKKKHGRDGSKFVG